MLGYYRVGERYPVADNGTAVTAKSRGVERGCHVPFIVAGANIKQRGATDELTGQSIAAFVTLRGGFDESDALHDELRDHVGVKIGAIAKPKSIIFTPDLPKTRSGKIMRRLLRDISDHRDLGDVTTLANAEIVQAIADQAEKYEGDD